MAITDNIIAGYNLDESSGNAIDSSASGFDMTNNNTVGYAAGLVNNCADFGTANTNKFLSYGGDIGVGGNTTISLWVKLRTEIASGTWVLFQAPATGNNIWFEIQYNYNGGTRQISILRARSGISFGSASYTITLGTADWYNIIVTYDGSVVKGYINNVERTSLSESGNGSSGGLVSKTTIGCGFNATTGAESSFASTYQDIVYVWSRAIDSTERSTLYNSGAGYQPISDTSIKTIDGLAKASVKTVDGLAIASVKSWNGLT